MTSPIHSISAEVLKIELELPEPDFDFAVSPMEIPLQEPLQFELSLDLASDDQIEEKSKPLNRPSVASRKSETIGETANAWKTIDAFGEASTTTSASLLKKIAPDYPPFAIEKEHEGEVTLLVKIDTSGHPESIRVTKSSGHHLLDKAATTAVEQWIFTPARSNGQPVLSWLRIPIAFRLSEEEV